MLTKYLTVSPAAPGGFKTDARFRHAPTLKPDGAAEPKFKCINRRFVAIETAASLTKPELEKMGGETLHLCTQAKGVPCRLVSGYMGVSGGSCRFATGLFSCHAVRPSCVLASVTRMPAWSSALKSACVTSTICCNARVRLDHRVVLMSPHCT